MAPKNLKEIEPDDKHASSSARDATDTNSDIDGALINFVSPPSPFHTAGNFNQRLTSGMKSSTPKVGTTDVTQCTTPRLKGEKRTSDNSSSGNDYSNDSNYKNTIKRNHRGQRNTFPKRRRRRKELMSRESFFVNAHQELLFRYGSGYRDFVIPYESQPEEPSKTRRGQNRKEP